MSPGTKQSSLTLDRNVGEQQPTCDVPACDGTADYRAPKSRDNLRDYYWFCLAHVREYNSAWNYYAGMTADQIEAEVRRDIDWQRPTWPLGQRGLNATQAFRTDGLLDDTDAADGREQWTATRHPEAEALAIMNLSPPVAIDDLKRRYKVLVKRHHPDTNGGDKKAEERLKAINIAYNKLLAYATDEAAAMNTP